jgi:hypothetical protein
MGSKMKRVTLAAAVLGLAVSASTARAATLLPGGDVVPTMMADDPNGATKVADTSFQNFDVTQNGVSLMGFGRAAVLTNYASNPFGPDALTFIYQVGLITAAPDGQSIASLIVSGFAGVQTDVGFYQEVGLIDPVDASRTAAPGASISFNFGDGALVARQETSILVVNTDARSYHAGTLKIEAGAEVFLMAYGAAPLVPEPTSIVAAATGLATIGAVDLRRRRRSSHGA